jgi:hypothetical protein
VRNLRQFWTARRIGENRVTLARLGPLRLWLARADREWGFACEHGELSDVLDIAQVPEDVVPGSLDWNATLFAEAPREFLLKPTVPDRSVVVKPTYPVRIPVGESGTFFVLLPLFVRILVAAGKREQEIGVVPSRLLSDTWFGLPTDGEFCYSLPFPAERDIERLQPLPHHIVCPVEIRNQSSEDLKFEKLCFRPQYAAILCGDRHLWSTPVRILHEGHFKGATIRYLDHPPEFERDLLPVSKPVKREDRGLSRLTFSSGFSRDIIFAR